MRKLKRRNIDKLKRKGFNEHLSIYNYLKALDSYKNSALMFYKDGRWYVLPLGWPSDYWRVD